MGSKAIDMGGSDTRPAGRKAEVANAHAFIRIGYLLLWPSVTCPIHPSHHTRHPLNPSFYPFPSFSQSRLLA